MKKRIELPIIEPVYATYHYQGCGSAVIADNLSIKNWYLNNIILLCCEKRFLTGYSGLTIGVCFSSWHNVPHLEKHAFETQFIKGHTSAVIKELLNNGYYVIFTGVDDYYIEGKTWYKDRHFSHDGLICGYDDNDKTYTVHAYDSNWIYSKFKTSQKAFEQGRISMFKQGEYGKIYGIKPKPEIVEFEPKKALNSVAEYLDPKRAQLPKNYNDMIIGPEVHTYLGVYMDMLYAGSIPYEKMDWRVFRQIWEHKKVMADRLSKTEQYLHLDNKISSEYQKIVADANKMRMMYASHHIKRRDSVLPIIREKLLSLRDSEGELLTDFLEKAGY